MWCLRHDTRLEQAITPSWVSCDASATQPINVPWAPWEELLSFSLAILLCPSCFLVRLRMPLCSQPLTHHGSPSVTRLPQYLPCWNFINWVMKRKLFCYIIFLAGFIIKSTPDGTKQKLFLHLQDHLPNIERVPSSQQGKWGSCWLQMIQLPFHFYSAIHSCKLWVPPESQERDYFFLCVFLFLTSFIKVTLFLALSIRLG